MITNPSLLAPKTTARLCKNCKKVTSGKLVPEFLLDFCDRSCFEEFNRTRPKSKRLVVRSFCEKQPKLPKLPILKTCHDCGELMGDRCRPCLNKHNRMVLAARKELAISLLGGKCQRCGVAGHSCIYNFHHFDPDLPTYESWKDSKKDDIQQWLKDQQIILLCLNCHALVHEYLEPAFIKTA